MAGQNCSPRIAMPNSVNVKFQAHDGPLAAPVSLPIQGQPGELCVMSHGGLTKLEHIAGQIAASLAADTSIGVQALADTSVAIAAKVLEASAEKQREGGENADV